MSTLKDRINAIGTVTPSLTPVPVIGKDYMAMTVHPTVRVQITPSVIYYEDLQPIISADGAPLSATGPGTWGQLYAAGTRGR